MSTTIRHNRVAIVSSARYKVGSEDEEPCPHLSMGFNGTWIFLNRLVK